jgi:hypothetical protein
VVERLNGGVGEVPGKPPDRPPLGVEARVSGVWAIRYVQPIPSIAFFARLSRERFDLPRESKYSSRVGASGR